MFCVEFEKVDYRTGQRICGVLPQKYKTIKGAESAAGKVRCVVCPPGGVPVSEVWARAKVV